MIGTIVIVLASIGVGVLVDRKWGVLPRKDRLLAAQRRGLPRPGYAAGEAPSTAIAARPGELEKLRRRSLDAHDLVVLRARCRKCGLARTLYVAPA